MDDDEKIEEWGRIWRTGTGALAHRLLTKEEKEKKMLSQYVGSRCTVHTYLLLRYVKYKNIHYYDNGCSKL